MSEKPVKPPTSSERAIVKRRSDLRAGRSVRQVSRDQFEQDRDNHEGRKVRNRKSWARSPYARTLERITER